MLDEGRKITYIRVYSGKIKTGEDIYNANNKKKEKGLQASQNALK